MRFFVFLILFAIIIGTGYEANTCVGHLIAGFGFGIAYFYGEGNVKK